MKKTSKSRNPQDSAILFPIRTHRRIYERKQKLPLGGGHSIGGLSDALGALREMIAQRAEN